MKLLALVLVAIPVRAQQAQQNKPRFYSPTLAVLEQEAAKDPNAGTLEDINKNAGTTFNGSQEQPPVTPVDPSGKTYVMEGTAPIPGVNIYKPKEDPNGDGRTEKPKPKPLIDSKWTWGALGLGVIATIAGIWFAPLLFVGGALLGAGAVLWFIGKKTKPKE